MKHRANTVASILGNFEHAEAMYQSALNATGSAAQEHEKYVDSLQGRLNQLTTAWQAFSNSFMDSGFLKGIVGGATDLLNVLDGIAKTMGTFPTIIGVIAAAMSAFKNVGIFSRVKDSVTGDIKSIELSVFGMTGKVSEALSALKNDVEFKFDEAFNKQLASDKSTLGNLIDHGALENGTDNLKNVNKSIKEYVEQTDKASISVNHFEGYQKAMAVTSNNSAKTFKGISNALSVFNSITDKTGATQKGFTSALSAANPSLSSYLSKVSAGKASLAGYGASLVGATIKTIVLTAAQTALNAALTMGVSFIIEAAIGAIAGWINANENLAESIDDVINKYNEQKEAVKNAKAVVDEVVPKEGETSRYQDLAKGVDSLGNNVSLTSDEYSEYLGIVNRIAETFPELVQGFDSNGNAILSCKGNVDALTEAYNKLGQAANDELLKNIDDIQQDFKNDIGEMNDDGWFKDKPTIKTYGIIEDMINSKNAESILKNNYSEYLNIANALKDAKIGDYESINAFSWQWDYEEYILDAIKTDKVAVQRIVEAHNKELDSAASEMKQAAQAMMSKAFDFGGEYSDVSDTVKAIAQQAINNLDGGFYKKIVDNGGSVEDYINSAIDALGNLNEDQVTTIETAFDLQTKFNNGEVSYAEYSAALNNAQNVIDHLDGVDGEIKEQLNLSLDTKEAEKQYETFVNRLVESGWQRDSAEKFAKSLNGKEMQVAFDLVAEGNLNVENAEEFRAQIAEQVELDKAMAFSLDVTAEAEGVELLTNALKEANSATGLTAESMAVLAGRYQDIEGYDPASLFEETANGITLNTEAVNDLEDAYAESKLEETNSALTTLRNEYDELGVEIQNCTDATRKAQLIGKREDIRQQIVNIAEQAAAYEGLTSAYNAWQRAESAGSDRDMYSNIHSAMSGIKEELDQGWVDDGTREYFDLIWGDNWDGAGKNVSDYKTQWKTLDDTIAGTSYSLQDFFKTDEDGNLTSGGIRNFFNAIKEKQKSLGKEWVKTDKDGNLLSFDFGVDGTKAVADALGISEELVEIFLRASQDCGFVVSFDGTYKQLADLQNEATEAANNLKEMGKTDFDFDFNSDSISDLRYQLTEAKKILDDKSFWNADGTFNFDAKGAKDAMLVVSTLQAKVDSLDNKYIGLTVEDETFEEPLKLLQDYESQVDALNQLKLNPKANAEEIELAEENLENIAQQMMDLPDSVKVDLGIDGIESVDEMQKAIESGEVKIPTTLDIQTNIDENIEDLVKVSLLGSGVLSSDEEETIRQELRVEYGISEDSEGKEDVEQKTDEAVEEATSGDKDPVEVDKPVIVNPVVGSEPGMPDLDEIVDSYTAEEQNVVLKFIADPSDVENYEIKDKETIVRFIADSILVDDYTPEEKEAYARYLVDGGDIDGYTPEEKQAIVEYLTDTGDPDSWTPEQKQAVAKFKKDSSEVDGYTPEQKQAIAKFIKDSTDPDKYIPENKQAYTKYIRDSLDVDIYQPDDKTATVTYRKDSSAVDSYNPGNIFRKVIYTVSEMGKTAASKRVGRGAVDGTAFANGTMGRAFRNGDWGIGGSGTALGAELGPELLVRDGQYHVIGENGAEFFDYKPNDIIFNAKQTAELFKYGKLTNGKTRGRAFADGNAQDIVQNQGNATTHSASGEVSGSDKATVLEYTVEFDADDALDTIDMLNEALADSASETGLTADEVDNLTKTYGKCKSFNPARLFEKTANGIKVNKKELALYNKELVESRKAQIQQDISGLVNEYNQLTEAISQCSNAEQRKELIGRKDNIGQQIEGLQTEAAFYDAIGGAYNRWVESQSLPQNYDAYGNIAADREAVEEEMSRGFIGDTSKEWIDVLSGYDLAGVTDGIRATTDEYYAAYQKLSENVGNTNVSILDMFTVDENGKPTAQGIHSFFDAIQQDFNGSIAKLNEETDEWDYNFSAENLQRIQDEWGLGIDAIGLMLQAAADAGYEVDWGDFFEGLELTESPFEELVGYAEQAQSEINKIFGTNNSYDYTATNVGDATSEIEKAQANFRELGIMNADGTINFEVEGAQEAAVIMAALINQKNQLNEPSVMSVDTTQLGGEFAELGTYIAKIQQYQQALDNYRVAAASGNAEDIANATSQLETAATDLQAASTALNNSNPEIAAELNVDKITSEANAVIATVGDNTKPIDVKVEATEIATNNLGKDVSVPVLANITGIAESMLATNGALNTNCTLTITDVVSDKTGITVGEGGLEAELNAKAEMTFNTIVDAAGVDTAEKWKAIYDSFPEGDTNSRSAFINATSKIYEYDPALLDKFISAYDDTPVGSKSAFISATAKILFENPALFEDFIEIYDDVPVGSKTSFLIAATTLSNDPVALETYIKGYKAAPTGQKSSYIKGSMIFENDPDGLYEYAKGYVDTPDENKDVYLRCVMSFVDDPKKAEAYVEIYNSLSAGEKNVFLTAMSNISDEDKAIFDYILEVWDTLDESTRTAIVSAVAEGDFEEIRQLAKDIRTIDEHNANNKNSDQSKSSRGTDITRPRFVNAANRGEIDQGDFERQVIDSGVGDIFSEDRALELVKSMGLEDFTQLLLMSFADGIRDGVVSEDYIKEQAQPMMDAFKTGVMGGREALGLFQGTGLESALMTAIDLGYWYDQLNDDQKELADGLFNLGKINFGQDIEQGLTEVDQYTVSVDDHINGLFTILGQMSNEDFQLVIKSVGLEESLQNVDKFKDNIRELYETNPNGFVDAMQNMGFEGINLDNFEIYADMIDRLNGENVQTYFDCIGLTEALTSAEAFNDWFSGLDDKDKEQVVSLIGEMAPQLATDLTYLSNGDDFIVTFKPNVNEFNAAVANATQPGSKTITVHQVFVNEGATPVSSGSAKVSGTAFADGTTGRAFRSGNWGTKDSGTALMAELGPELLVRDGHFYTVGENSAEFVRYKRGDIIFNADQTKQIFEKGKISNGKKRGYSFAMGTIKPSGKAFAWSSTVHGAGNWLEQSKNNTGFGGGYSGGGNNSGNSSSSNSSGGSEAAEEAEEFLETLDWIEVAIDRIERAINKLDTTASSTFKTWGVRSEALVDQIGKVREEIDLQQRAAERYLQQANSVGLSEDWASLVRAGKVDIQDIDNEELKEQIDSYREWYEKMLDCQDAVVDLTEKVSELYQTAFENVSKEYEGALSFIEHEKNVLDEYINQSEAQAWLVSKLYYDALADNERENISKLEEQKAALLSSLNDAVANGNIKEGSEAWVEMCNQIDEITMSIMEGNTQLLEYAQTIQELDWEQFDILQDKISRITSESEFLIDLLSSDELYDDRGQLTDSGMSTMGLHGMNYNVEMYQADQAAKEAERLRKELETDPFDQDLLDRYHEMIDLQQEHIQNAQDEKEAIRDMVSDGIELELDALQELIDKRNEALDAEKDLYDYQQQVAEKTAEIATIEKQLAAYQGDMSEETKAKVQELKVSLEKAKEDLAESEYDRYIQDQEKLLDELYNSYSEILNARLDNLDLLVSDMIVEINASAGTISSTLSSKAEEVGYTLSDSLKTIWDEDFLKNNSAITNGSNAIKNVITSYGDKFTSAQTTTNTALGNIAKDMASMIGQLNKLAKTNIKSASTSTAAKKPEASGNANKPATPTTPPPSSTGDGTPKIGDKVKFVSGSYYYDSYGMRPLGSQNQGKEVYITNINTKGSHPYHISTGSKLGSGDLGWLKLNQISGYETGKRKFFGDDVAWTQENGREFIVRPSDGAILTPIAKGDGVLNAAASNNLWNVANNPSDFIKDNLAPGDIGRIASNRNQTNVTQNFGQIVLPNVYNYEEFREAMVKDKKMERYVQSVTIDRLDGKSRLAKYNSIK